MPKSGFKSVTINERLYNTIELVYKRHEEDLYYRGIHSMSAFVSLVLTSWLGEYSLPSIFDDSYKVGVERILREMGRKSK